MAGKHMPRYHHLLKGAVPKLLEWNGYTVEMSQCVIKQGDTENIQVGGPLGINLANA